MYLVPSDHSGGFLSNTRYQQRNKSNRMYFVLWRDRLGQYRITLKGANHEIIVTTEGYTVKASAQNALRLLRLTHALTPLKDQA